VPADRAIHGTSIKLDSALVTGATGHIGSALVHRLATEGVCVTALVRKHSPARSRLPAGPHVSAVEIDASDPRALRESIESISAEVVFNLASAGVNPADREPLAMLDGNVGLLASLLGAMENRKPRRFIHTGSCSEYDLAETGHRIAEDYSVKPSSLYGAAKLCASLYGAALAAERGIPFLNLRLFGVFGIGEASHRVVPYLIAKLRESQPVDLTPGEQIRDWLYIDDVVDALLAAATCEHLGHSGIFNVCSGQGIRVRELAEHVADAMNKPRDLLRFGARPYRSDEPMWIVGDNRRFVEATAWQPRVSIAEGIRRMLVQPA
jgi:UDP-glucose 4-epimerase